MKREDIYKAVDVEREHQDNKRGANRPQSLLGFIEILKKELQEVEDGWYEGIDHGRNSPLAELVQVVAVAVACMEKYGVEGTVLNKDDQVVIRGTTIVPRNINAK